jgi:hypothetical protein
LRRLAGCIDRGLTVVQDIQQELRAKVAKIQAVADTLDPTKGSPQTRRCQFDRLRRRFSQHPDPIDQHLAKIMVSFRPGLFVGPVADLPQDNLELERWFRKPKGHERRIHGRRHTGVRLVHEGPTLTLALDAHLHHPDPFTAADLMPYRSAQPPPSQQVATARRRTMRKARSSRLRPLLLAELERRYLDSS